MFISQTQATLRPEEALTNVFTVDYWIPLGKM